MSRVAGVATAASYKKLKEDFVSGLMGGSIEEINYVTGVASAAITLWSVLQARQSFFRPYTPLSFVVDFLLNVGGFLLATTLYANTPILLSILLLAPVGIIYTLPRPSSKKSKLPPSKPNNVEPSNPFPKKPFLTTYRGQMMVTTCLAILAVDFRIFPRRFAKVETWGTSLMDLGVGSFVFSAGLVGARPILKEKLSGKASITLLARLYQSTRRSFPLVVMGLIRLYTVKGLDYAEHVTEYGVHWNFFFTLAFLPPFVAVFQSAFQYIPSYAGLAILLSVAYQAVLEYTDLKAYILTAPRTSLLSKNREGVFGFFGYLAIFLAGQTIGLLVIPRSLSSSPTSASPTKQRQRLLLILATWSATWSILYLASTHYRYGLKLNVSRRLANLPYFFWICAFNTSQITIFCLIETIFFPAAHKTQLDSKIEDAIYKESTSMVMESFNRNGLALFLAANLGTGVVNLTVKTLHVGGLTAMGILIAYSAMLTGLAVGLDMKGISIKM